MSIRETTSLSLLSVMLYSTYQIYTQTLKIQKLSLCLMLRHHNLRASLPDQAFDGTQVAIRVLKNTIQYFKEIGWIKNITELLTHVLVYIYVFCVTRQCHVAVVSVKLLITSFCMKPFE